MNTCRYCGHGPQTCTCLKLSIWDKLVELQEVVFQPINMNDSNARLAEGE